MSFQKITISKDQLMKAAANLRKDEAIELLRIPPGAANFNATQSEDGGLVITYEEETPCTFSVGVKEES